MICPFCSKSETKVIDSRSNKSNPNIRRRRECPECEKRFTTYESLELHLPMVIKRDQRREIFNRQKIKKGLEIACQKRNISVSEIDKVVNQIEKKILNYDTHEILSSDIGNLVMLHLHHLDPVAYIRFASVYRHFQDVEEFVADIKVEQKKLSKIKIDYSLNNDQSRLNNN